MVQHYVRDLQRRSNEQPDTLSQPRPKSDPQWHHTLGLFQDSEISRMSLGSAPEVPTLSSLKYVRLPLTLVHLSHFS
jgi:hypothetical protein